jgi:hypothetical protein
MHNGTVGLDGPLHYAVAIFEVDDDDFGLRTALGLLPYTYEVVGFERAGIEAY